MTLHAADDRAQRDRDGATRRCADDRRSAAGRMCSSPTQACAGVVVRLHGGDVRASDAALIRVDAGRHHQRARALDGQPRYRRPRGMGRYSGNAWRRSVRERALPRPLDQRVDRAGHGSSTTAAWSPTFLPRTWSLPTTTADCIGRARSCCRRISAVVAGDPVALRAMARDSLAFRKRTQPLESPSAGCIFQNPEPSIDDPCPTAFRLRLARWSIARG